MDDDQTPHARVAHTTVKGVLGERLVNIQASYAVSHRIERVSDDGRSPAGIVRGISGRPTKGIAVESEWMTATLGDVRLIDVEVISASTLEMDHACWFPVDSEDRSAWSPMLPGRSGLGDNSDAETSRLSTGLELLFLLARLLTLLRRFLLFARLGAGVFLLAALLFLTRNWAAGHTLVLHEVAAVVVAR